MHPLGFNSCNRNKKAHHIKPVHMVLLFYFRIHHKSFIILKLNAWSAPLIQPISQISLQHKWLHQTKKKIIIKIIRIWCLTNKIQNTCYIKLAPWHKILTSSTKDHVCHLEAPDFAIKGVILSQGPSYSHVPVSPSKASVSIKTRHDPIVNSSSLLCLVGNSHVPFPSKVWNGGETVVTSCWYQ